MPEWVCHVDESGNRNGAEGGSDYFVLCGIAGSPGSLGELAERIRRLKLELVPRADPASWELHAGAMFHGRDSSPLGSIGLPKKLAVMRSVVNLVSDSDVVLFKIAVMSKKMRKSGASAARITEQAMALLAELLERLARELGGGTVIRVVSDNTHKKYRLAMERALSRRVTGRVRLPPGGERRVTSIEFVDSRSSALVQAADAIAYIIHRHIAGDKSFADMAGVIERKSWISRGRCAEKIGSGRRVGSTRSRRPWGGTVYVGRPWRGAGKRG